MPDLPVQRMVLYKHGVGFFERYGTVGETARAELTFKKEDMDDVLKSLAAFPQGEGQVVNVSYETPEDKQSALANAPILLRQDRALLDLLRSLQGRRVRLHLTDIDSSLPELQGVHTADDEVAIAGTLIGIDCFRPGAPTTQQSLDNEARLADTLISLMTSGHDPDSHPILRTYTLAQVRGVDVLDDQSGDDLRYVLDLSRASANTRSVTIVLNQPHQDLLVSYIAPTPTWRVSYRLVYTPLASAESPSASAPDLAEGKLLLQGWGIVDNQLDEDLDQVNLTLIAGQPISFVYDLYMPHQVDRPRVEDEARTVPGPVMFGDALPSAPAAEPQAEPMGRMRPSAARKSARREDAPRSMVGAIASPQRDMETAVQVNTAGTARGELFQYDVGAPVTIKRGQSAMVPIIGATVAAKKQHLYNGQKVPHHPVVTLTAKNTSGLTLERGPITVLEHHTYVGEAVMAFTPAGGEILVPYAVDLGVTVTERTASSRQTAGIRLGDRCLIRDEYHITTTQYTLENRTAAAVRLVIEQPIQTSYQLFDTTPILEKTAEYHRWAVMVEPRASQNFVTKQRRKTSSVEKLTMWSDRRLADYLHNHWIDQHLCDQLTAILRLYDDLTQQEKERDRLRETLRQRQDEQTLAAQKLEHLGTEGQEGQVRQRFVSKLSTLEDECDRLLQDIRATEEHQQTLQQTIDQHFQHLNA